MLSTTVLGDPGRPRDELVAALAASPQLRVRVGPPVSVPTGPAVLVLRSARPARDLRTRVARGTAPALVVTTVTDPAEAVRTLQAGATSYLIEGQYDRGELLAAVLGTAAGHSHLSPAVLAAVVRRLQHPERPAVPPEVAGRLSRRERQILDLVADGYATSVIARREFIAEKTVRNHLNNIYAKLGVRSRAEAVAAWLGSPRAAG